MFIVWTASLVNKSVTFIPTTTTPTCSALIALVSRLTPPTPPSGVTPSSGVKFIVQIPLTPPVQVLPRAT